MTLNHRLLIMQWACLGMAASSFALGAWMVLQPNAFWALLSAPAAGDAGMAVSTRVIYGGAILGEGVALLLVYLRPLQYFSFLHYMIAYKTAACIALAGWISSTQPTLWGGWLLFGGWASAGLIAAAVYPWGRWNEIVERLHSQHGARP